MFIYTGKLNHMSYAVNDMITIVFPRSLNIGETVCAFLQWTKDGMGVPKVNVNWQGKIDALELIEGGGLKIRFFADAFYTIDGTVTCDKKTMNLTMRHGTSTEISQTLHHATAISRGAWTSVP